MTALPIATLALDCGGTLGIAPCPGPRDAEAIRVWRPDAVLTLVEPGPRAEAVAALCAALDIAWHHLPIADFGAPDAAFEAGWRTLGPLLRGRLRGGGRVLVHCLAGRGRSGMIAARLLVELGEAAPDDAIAMVRRVRPGAVETEGQEAHVQTRRALRD